MGRVVALAPCRPERWHGPFLGRWRSLGFAVSVVLALTGCGGRRHAASSGGGSSGDGARRGPAIAVLDLSDELPERPPTNFLGLPGRAATFEDLGHAIDRLKSAKDVRGVLVKLGGASIGLARAAETGELLRDLGAKLPVYCHADDLGNATLFLAASGCKRVWLSPAGAVDAIGIAAQMVYLHKLLADELGLDVDFLQVGKYKGAEEPFTRDGPSPEALASLQSTLGDLRAAWLEGLRASRPGLAEGAAEDGPYAPQEAKKRGLVDEVGYFDEARDALEKATGAVRAEVRLGAGSSPGDGDLGEVLRALAGDSAGAAPVAVVRATGAISMEGGNGIGGGDGIVASRLLRTVARLAKDDDVKAVVLRIDSPGGSALASDLLWHGLMAIRAEKPLVVSIGGMAASGGFYLASAGTAVFADASSIVGSIGVVGGKVAIGRALERIGVHAETVPAKANDPHAAARAGAESLLLSWDDPTRARLLETMTSIYQLFLARVSEGRGIPVERVAASAEGRIFGGIEGKARGLVDEIGGLRQAIERARSLAKLPADARYAVVDEPSPLLEAIGDEAPQGRTPLSVAGMMPAAAAGLGAVERSLPWVSDFLVGLSPLLSGSPGGRVACALPFALTVK